MDWKQFSWEMFNILCQGTIGGLIVVFVTEWLRCCREKETLRNYATLVWMEVYGHKTGFDFIATEKQLPYDKPHPLKTSDWEQVKFDLAVIAPDDFKLLTAYYQSVDQLDTLFTNYHGADWKFFAQPFHHTHYMCKSSLDILDKYRTLKPNVFLRLLHKFQKIFYRIKSRSGNDEPKGSRPKI